MKKHLLKIASLIFVLALVLATFAACSASGGAGGVVDACFGQDVQQHDKGIIDDLCILVDQGIIV